MPFERMVAAALRGALAAFVKPIFRAGRPVAQQRRWLAAVTRAMPVPRGVRFEHGRVGGIPGEWVAAKSRVETGRTILYLHGGAYCVGSPATHRAITGHLALRCRARVFAADYRLAPEHPFPAAVDDAVAAYRGLLAGAQDAAGIVLVGDSAGGGLCVATALALRGLGLPRTLIQVGTDELLLPDSRRLHARLEAAGVRSTLGVHARRWHVFQMQAGVLRDADRALEEVAGFVSA